MTIAMTCAECGKSSNVPDSFAGKRGRCKGCGAAAVVPNLPTLQASRAPKSIEVESWPDPPRAAVPLPEMPWPSAEIVRPSAPVPSVRAASASPTRVVSELVACAFCGESILAAAKKCKHCGEFLDPVLRAAQQVQAMPQQVIVHNTAISHATAGGRSRRWSPGVAALLSLFVPGLGQMYKGQAINGLAWLFFVVIGYVAFIVPGFVLHMICIIGAASGDPTA
jgi:TM2 domain-containing membrane protein YozV